MDEWAFSNSLLASIAPSHTVPFWHCKCLVFLWVCVCIAEVFAMNGKNRLWFAKCSWASVIMNRPNTANQKNWASKAGPLKNRTLNMNEWSRTRSGFCFVCYAQCFSLSLSLSLKIRGKFNKFNRIFMKYINTFNGDFFFGPSRGWRF